MFVFLTLTLQMGHTVQMQTRRLLDEIGAVLLSILQTNYGTSRFYHILRFLHFTDNNRTTDSNDRLSKIRNLFEIRRTNFAKILQSFRTFDNRRGHSEIQGSFSNSTFLKKRKGFGIKM